MRRFRFEAVEGGEQLGDEGTPLPCRDRASECAQEGLPRSQRPRPRLAIDCGTPIASSSSSSVRVASSAVAMQATPMAIKISTVIIAAAILLSSVDRITKWCFACEVLPTPKLFVLDR
jgi:hypothetical protein